MTATQRSGPPARAPHPRRVSGLVAPPVLLAALLAGLGAYGAPRADAAPDGTALVEEANRKLRQRDVAAALKLLGEAIRVDPANVDAHMRYQDVAREPLGLAAVEADYTARAKARPDDPVAQFLAARLLPAEKAAAEFERQTKQFDASPWAFAGLARAREELGRTAEAAAAHAEALHRAGDQRHRFLAFRAYGIERTGHWAAAANAWGEVVEKAPKDLPATLGLAECLRRAGRLDDALVALDAAQKLGVEEPEIQYRRGLVHFDGDRWDKALEAFDAAIRIDRRMVESYCAAAEAALRRAYDLAGAEGRPVVSRDFNLAASYGERAVISVPESAYAHYVLGAVFEAQAAADPDRLETALQEYNNALERIPLPGADRVRVLTAKAWVLALKGRWDASLDASQKAVEIDRNCVAAYGHAGYVLCALGRHREAVEKWYRPALKIEPANARILHDMGVALWEQGKPRDARRPLEDARTAAPRNGRYRLSLGELYYHLRLAKEAAAELKLATELRPYDAAAWRSLGRACYSAKDWADCVRAYERCVALDADAVDEYLVLAVVCSEQLKDRDRARRFAQQFRLKGGEDENLDSWLAALLGETPGSGGGSGGR